MKTRIVLLLLCLSGCVSAPPGQDSDALIYNGYREGHLEMLAVHAPWMSEAQKQAHADSQAREVLKSIRLQQQTGQVVPPIIIPLGEPPASPTAAVADARPTVSVQPTAPVPLAPNRTPDRLVAPQAPSIATDRQVSTTIPPQATSASKGPDKSFVAGTFVMEGGGYSAQVAAKGTDLLVVDSGRSSLYSLQDDGTYRFRNRNGSVFSLKVLDQQTLLFDRIPSSGNPTRMLRETTSTAALSANSEADLEIAERYRQRALSEPQDAQLWTMCAAAAYKRSVSDGQNTARYARQMAASIRQILTSQSNPCPDAISAEHW